MKISKRIKAGLCALAATVLVAAAGVVVACSDDDDDSSGGGEEEEEEEEETGGETIEVDVSNITLSSTCVQLLDATTLSGAASVTIVFSNEGNGTDWLSLYSGESTWADQIDTGIYSYSSSSGTHTITITTSGYTITYDESWSVSDKTGSYTVSTYAEDDGIWCQASGCTIESVTYTTGSADDDDEEEEDDDDDDSTTYSLIDVSDWDELLDETLSVSSSGDINTSGTLTQVLAADDFADYKAIVIQGTATKAGYDTDGSELASSASWLTAGGSSGSWTYGFISWPTATTTGSTTVSIIYQLYADESNVVKVWEGGYEIYESSSIDDFEKGIYLAGQYVEDIMVYGYGGTISFEEVEDNSESSGDAGEHADSVELYSISITLSSDFMMGFEGSCVSQLEEKGYSYCDADGEAGDPFEIAADYGANWARVRLWHTPLTKSDGNNTTERAIEMGKEIKSAGMSFLLDFHYSDDWADPGAQAYPEAWDEITAIGESTDTEASSSSLCGTVYEYTLDVLTKLKNAGCTPDMVQLGNEINNGMLMTLSDGSTDATVQCSAGSSNMAAVLTAAANAVHAVDTDIKIMLHIASNRRYSTSTYTSWFTTLESAGFDDYDYIGLSYYPFYGHGTVGALKDNIAALKAAGLGNNDSASVLVVETSWPWTNDNGDSTSNILTYSNAYMSAYMTEDSNNLSDSGSDLLEEIEFETYGSTSYIAFSAQNQVTIFEIIVEAVADAGGCGVFYWGSEWIPNSYTGSTWDNQALFDFDGICMPSMKMFSVSQ